MPRSDHTSHLALTLGMSLVFVVALLLRLGHLHELQTSFDGAALFGTPRVDARYHWDEAVEILDRDFLLRDKIPWKAPGYSYFLAALISIVGRAPAAVRWALAVLGAANCAALVLLARRWLCLRFSVAAGLLAALNGILIVFDTELYQPTLLISLNLPALLLLSRPQAGSAAYAGAGALLGAACLVHPSYLITAALLALWISRRRVVLGLYFLLALAVVLSPHVLTNYFVRGQPLVTSWNGGINLYAANSPTFDQYAGNGTFAWGRMLAAPRDAGFERESDIDRLYLRLALRQAARFPSETLLGMLHKAWIFFSPVEYASNFRIYELREYSRVLSICLGRWGPVWLPFGIWGPVALLGLALSIRHSPPRWALPALWSLGVLLSSVLFFNTARYRAPVVFFGCIWVAVALAAGWDLWRERRWRRLAAGAGFVAVLATVLSATAVPQTALPLPLEWDQAMALTPGPSFEEAARWAERAVQRDPDSPVLRKFVSEFYERWNRWDRQRDHLHHLLELPDLEPDLVDAAHERLGRSYLAEGNLEQAHREYEAALAVGADDTEWRGYPYYPLGLPPVRSCLLRLELARVELLQGKLAEARRRAARVREDCPETGNIRDRLLRLAL